MKRHEGVQVKLYHSWPRHYMEVSGKPQASATLAPEKEPPVPIG
jgi:hypothetical protein